LQAVAACAILSADMYSMKLLFSLLLSLAVALAPLYPAPAHAVALHSGMHADAVSAHAGTASAGPFAALESPAHECGQIKAGQSCDGQCCGVCILTLAGSVPYMPTAAAFGVEGSPTYRAHSYTSFVAPLLGRPPQFYRQT